MRLLTAHLEARFPARVLAVYRMILGAAMIFTVPEVTSAVRSSGSNEALWFIPALHRSLASPFGLLFAAIGISLLIGLWTRWSAILLGLLTLYVMYYAGRYQNHLAFSTSMLFLTALSDSGRAWSLDAIRRGDSDVHPTVLAWPVTLIKLQVCVLYFFAALNKVNDIYWTGDTIRLVARNSKFWPFPVNEWPLVFVAFAVVGLAWEFLAPFALWIKGWPQAVSMIAGVAIHVGMAMTLADSGGRLHGVFIFMMIPWGAYLLFNPLGPRLADWLVRRATRGFIEVAPPTASHSLSSAPATPRQPARRRLSARPPKASGGQPGPVRY